MIKYLTNFMPERLDKYRAALKASKGEPHLTIEFGPMPEGSENYNPVGLKESDWWHLKYNGPEEKFKEITEAFWAALKEIPQDDLSKEDS